MSGTTIDSIAALEDVIGKTPPTMDLKVIDHLDHGALRWIAASPLMFAGFGDRSAVGITLAGGAPGFASGSAAELRLPLCFVDDAAGLHAGAPFGALFLIPGIRETLRVNGRVAAVGADDIRIDVEECYGHCAKALIRSDFWSAAPVDIAPDAPAFIAASRFMALATISAERHADLSPKGDPANCMAQLDQDMLWFADRPGNRRVDSFRNIVVQPGVALALIVPGSPMVATVRGKATLTTDPAARARFAVQGKTPLLAIGVSDMTVDLRPSAALARACLWPAPAEPPAIDPAALFLDHIKLNRDAGLGARLAVAALAVPGVAGLLKKGLEKDYKDNLY